MTTTAFDLIQSEMERVAEAQAQHAELECSMRKLCDEFTELAGKAGIRMAFTVATKSELQAKNVGVRINITKGNWPFRKHANVKIQINNEVCSNYDYHSTSHTDTPYGDRMGSAGFRKCDATFEQKRTELHVAFKEFLFKGVLSKSEAEKMQTVSLKL